MPKPNAEPDPFTPTPDPQGPTVHLGGGCHAPVGHPILNGYVPPAPRKAPKD
jgi:hypothetical protein